MLGDFVRFAASRLSQCRCTEHGGHEDNFGSPLAAGRQSETAPSAAKAANNRRLYGRGNEERSD